MKLFIYAASDLGEGTAAAKPNIGSYCPNDALNRRRFLNITGTAISAGITRRMPMAPFTQDVRGTRQSLS